MLDLSGLDERGIQIVADLMPLIPSWQFVDLTKKGYNEQYAKTLLDVAIYVCEREKKVIEEMINVEKEERTSGKN